MNSKFEVIACNPSNEGKTFVWKLQVIVSDVVVFGVKKTVKRTYYIGAMPQAAKIGDVFEEDLSRFDIKMREFPHPETGELIMLSWLHVKVA